MNRLAKLTLVIGILAVLILAGYQRLSESQKHFVQELVRQSPYLIPRYYV
jgi:predicted nucleic acid-binding protein